MTTTTISSTNNSNINKISKYIHLRFQSTFPLNIQIGENELILFGSVWGAMQWSFCTKPESHPSNLSCINKHVRMNEPVQCIYNTHKVYQVQADSITLHMKHWNMHTNTQEITHCSGHTLYNASSYSVTSSFSGPFNNFNWILTVDNGKRKKVKRNECGAMHVQAYALTIGMKRKSMRWKERKWGMNVFEICRNHIYERAKDFCSSFLYVHNFLDFK